MRKSIYILTFLFSTTLLLGQPTNNQVLRDTVIYSRRKCIDCPAIMDTVIYRLLKCGLYEGSNGDLGYQSESIVNENFNRGTRYITWIYGADQNDTIDGGLKEMKYVIDTASFQFLSYMYWADKNNIYGFTPMSDGGTISLKLEADKKSFIVFENTEYAKDKKNVYYHNSILKEADSKTFKTINNKETPGLAFDKNYIYMFGERLTEKDIEELKLSSYIKKN
jgi:hypothetical protein